MTNLGASPTSGFHFTAAPPKVKGMGTFPVRAYAARLSKRGLQPVGDDRAAQVVGAAMFDRKAELGIDDRVRGPDASLSTTTRRRLTFARQFIRAVFSWPTKQPFEKLTPLNSAALHSSHSKSPSSARPSQTPRRKRCSSQPRRRVRSAGAEPAAASATAKRGSGTPSPPSFDQCTAIDGSRSMRIGRRRR